MACFSRRKWALASLASSQPQGWKKLALRSERQPVANANNPTTRRTANLCIRVTAMIIQPTVRILHQANPRCNPIDTCGMQPPSPVLRHRGKPTLIGSGIGYVFVTNWLDGFVFGRWRCARRGGRLPSLESFFRVSFDCRRKRQPVAAVRRFGCPSLVPPITV